MVCARGYRRPEEIDDDGGMDASINKPYHLMTPAERTTARIRQNREIDEKVAVTDGKRIPVASTRDYVRGTPNERAKVGGVIRKVRP